MPMGKPMENATAAAPRQQATHMAVGQKWVLNGTLVNGTKD